MMMMMMIICNPASQTVRQQATNKQPLHNSACPMLS
jgi:hypothetical protein